MARSILDLTDWLVGSIDYCAEGNLIQTRSFMQHSSQLDQFLTEFDQGVFYPHVLLPKIYQIVPLVKPNSLEIDSRYSSHLMPNYIQQFPILPIAWQPELIKLFQGISLLPLQTLTTADLDKPLALIPIANGEITNQEYANNLLHSYQDLAHNLKRISLYTKILEQSKPVDNLFFLQQHAEVLAPLQQHLPVESLQEQLKAVKASLFSIPADQDPKSLELFNFKSDHHLEPDGNVDQESNLSSNQNHNALQDHNSLKDPNTIKALNSTKKAVASKLTSHLTTTTDDFAQHSVTLPSNLGSQTEIIPLSPPKSKVLKTSDQQETSIEIIEIATSQLPSVPKVDPSFIPALAKQAKPYIAIPYGRVTNHQNEVAWLIDNFKQLKLPVDYQPLLSLPMPELVGNLVNIGNQVMQQHHHYQSDSDHPNHALASQTPVNSSTPNQSSGSKSLVQTAVSASAIDSELLAQLNPLTLKQQVQQDLTQQINQQSWMHEPDLLKRAHLCLEQVFGYSEFRPLQHQIIASILSGQDTLAILATGSGKSLCYQIPALCLNGCTLVISPLLALMHDQIKQLQTYNIEAAILSGNTTYEEKQQIYQGIRQGRIKLLYISPEKITLGNTLREIARLPIAFIAIDEAHCVSQWGHDFRPNYLKLHLIRKQFNYTIPVLAATATARLETRQEMIKYLDLHDPQVVVGDFDRKNIFISVEEVAADKPKYKKLVNLLENPDNTPAIVYCFTRNTVERICQQLQDDGFSATRYHAELSPTEKSLNQKDFISGKKNIMVATIAFGMGINKGDIRLVAHYDFPSSIENYYQEIGRAGRDGEKSLAVLFSDESSREWRENIILQPPTTNNSTLASNSINEQDQVHLNANHTATKGLDFDLLQSVDKLKPQYLQHSTYHSSNSSTTDDSNSSNNSDADYDDKDYDLVKVKLEKFREVLNFCDTSNCRRRILLAAFNQFLDQGCNNCDNCRNRSYRQIEIHKDFKIILGLLKVFEQFLTYEGLISILIGKVKVESELMRAWVLANRPLEPSSLQDFNQRITKLVAETSIAGETYWRALTRQLIDLGYIKYDKKYSYLQITQQGVTKYNADTPLTLQKTPSLIKRNVYKQALTMELDYIRENVADILDLRYDQLLPDPTLRKIVENLPSDLKALKAIEGMNDFRLKHLGKYILGAIDLYHQRVKLKDVNYKRKIRM